MSALVEGVRKYAELEGRESRADYWEFVVWNSIIGLGLSVGDHFLFPHHGAVRGPLTLTFTALMASPAWCFTVRRLHDKNVSGWWSLLGFIPVIGQFALFMLLIQDGDKVENDYGLPPGRLQGDALPNIEFEKRLS